MVTLVEMVRRKKSLREFIRIKNRLHRFFLLMSHVGVEIPLNFPLFQAHK